MAQHQTGRILAVLFFLGGAAIIRSLMRPAVNMPFLMTGMFLLLVAVILLIRALTRIRSGTRGPGSG